MAFTIAATGRLGRAQDVEKLENAEVDVRPRQVVINVHQFDTLVFGGGGADAFRRDLEFRLTAHLKRVDRIYTLTEFQKKKLSLAGRGDIKRLFDHAEETRREVQQESIDRVELRRVLREFRRLPDKRSDLFGEESLFSKCLKNTLTAEQWARHQQLDRDQVAAQHRLTITWVVAMMDVRLNLNKDQRRRFEQLLVMETRPPKKFGEYDYHGVMYQVSRVPEATLRLIFNDIQWGKLSPQLAEAVRLERTLKDGGYVPDDQVVEGLTRGRDQALAGHEQP